ncbi:MAG: FliA/WhiG family RNA polymerase sigma factor [Candidatus Sumerlaeia bacterium]
MPTKGANPYGKETRPSISMEERNRMVEENLPLVRFVASRIAGRLPSHVELDDLINSGVIGLIDAVEKFDPTRKIKFKTYAEFRIKGAILDELRALDWVPRSTRQKATRIEKAFAELEQKLGRMPSDHEVVEHMGVDFDTYHQLIQEARGISLISLDELHSDNEDENERNLLEFLADPDDIDPAEALNLDQVYQIVAESIDMLPEKERLVISLYYHDELTMKEIGEILGITESRVSQIHTKAILRLRGRLSKVIEV